MQLINLSRSASVAGQIHVQDIPEISAMGFDILINNRPDFETSGQPLNSDIANAALRHGLEYYYFPVTALNFPGDSLRNMAALFDDSSRKTLAFCRSGTRSANLWLATIKESKIALDSADEVARLGIDPAMFFRFASHRG